MLSTLIYATLHLLAFTSLVLADTPTQQPLHEYPSSQSPKRVAIIGAGAGGTSLSYHLRKYASSQPEQIPLDITIFDRNPYIGGRATIVNAFSLSEYPVELGASIFVAINHILVNATRELNLTSSVKIYQAPPEAKYELGVWDGTSFVFTADVDDDDNSSARGWWGIVKLLWRYGLAPIRTRRAAQAAAATFSKFYEPPLFPFHSLQEVIEETGLIDYTSVTGTEALINAGVSEKFRREIVQASTRVNYASNLDAIHGLEALVCMAVEGATAVEGGNAQIFEAMAKVAADRVLLNTTVTDVVRDDKSNVFQLSIQNLTDLEMITQDFDTVVLAAPFQFSNLSFTPPLVSPPKPVPYVPLHVTLFTTPYRLSPSFFNLENIEDVPASVLTTLPPKSSSTNLTSSISDSITLTNSAGSPGFWSISTLQVLTDVPNYPDSPQYLYKIFSPAPLKASWLAELFDIPYITSPSSSSSSESFEEGQDQDQDSISSLPDGAITWYHHKFWHSYPYETPRRQFEDFELTMQSPTTDSATSSSNLWYLSGMESFISTMETSALAGMNVARLIVDGWVGD
ncbi:hypothetical protein PV10_00560 [Exophiala mesophila]|uniref:Prenylcysteine lyase domain-containing protein n=1 Tax=Exophiala mesophila TaxID=212818 RepID=A0A0D1ZRY9_EXOME|nr:uncharacterized protein PV10_00560 [Exophiala mesophila]KIV96734.1 hypothetical protein PV10_00560 [Exophiala mesophila]